MTNCISPAEPDRLSTPPVAPAAIDKVAEQVADSGKIRLGGAFRLPAGKAN